MFSWLRCDVDGQDNALVDEIWNECLNVLPVSVVTQESQMPFHATECWISLVQEGLHAASDKIEAIVNAPSPKDVKKSHSSLGLVN